MKNLTDIRVKKMSNIIEDYLNCLDSIKETFNNNYPILTRAKTKAEKSKNNFLRSYTVDDLTKKPILIKDWKDKSKRANRAQQAEIIFPQSMLVSLVSQYDYLIGQLIGFIYEINPNSLKESNSQISFKDLFSYNDINEIKNKIIRDKIDNILRKSHEEQIDDLKKLANIKELKKVSFWDEFIEITQRRNLLVHCKGEVSDQYIQKCSEVGIDIDCNKATLNVSEDYFNRAYFIFYIMGAELSQVIIRHLLKKENLLSEIDTILNKIIYDAIEEEKYDIAIELSKFALADSTKHTCNLDLVYFVLNYAQAYKWSGNEEMCKKTLSTYDFTATTSDILVAKFALEDNIKKVVEHMKKAGNNSEIMNTNAYVSWAIFKNVRKIAEFQEAYKEIFGQDFTSELSFEENQVVKEFEEAVLN